jgi:hypothetical protein
MTTMIAGWFAHLPFGGVILANAGDAFKGIATELAGYLTGFVTLMLVVIGYIYASSVDDPQKATAAKRAIGMVIVGGIIIAGAVSFAPTLTGLFKK